MRWYLLVLLLASAGCSRAPSPQEAYQQAWRTFRQGKLQQAQDVVDRALRADKAGAVATPLVLLRAEILLSKGQFHEASDLFERLSDSTDPELHLRLAVDRAEALWKTGRVEEAFPLLDEVDRSAAKSTADPIFKSQLVRSAILIQQGQYDAAEDILRATAQRAAEVGDSFNEAAANLNFSFAKLRRERDDESIDFSLHAVRAAEKAGASRIVALATNNLGIAYAALGDLDRAKQYQTSSVAQLREIGDQRNLEDAIGELGNLHLLNAHPELAQPVFEEAVSIANKIDSPADAARWAGQYAVALIQQKRWSDAKTWNDRAFGYLERVNLPEQVLYLKLNEAAVNNGLGRRDQAIEEYRKVITESDKSPFLEWNAHVQLAALLVEAKRDMEANEEYERGLRVIEQVRSELLSPDFRIRYHDRKMEFFRDYVDLLVEEGRVDRALQVVEYSRARVLAESLGRQPHSIDEVHLPSMQRYAQRTGSVLLSYWLGSRRSFVWVITPTSLRMVQVAGEKEIGNLIHGYRKAIEDDLRDPIDSDLPQGRQLRAILLDPVQKELAGAKHVIVVPDGSLHSLNFESLPGADAHHYWIEEAELSIAPSLDVLTASTPSRGAKPSLLLIGAPVSPNPDYPALPSAAAEIDSIQNRFDAKQRVVRTGQNATPQAFLDSMPGKFSMIHFTAHAEANSQNPLEAAVILSNGHKGYKLYASDIVGLKLSANLVTISACRGAGTQAYGGEGLVGFAWAFLQSGAHSVVAGLWDVGDASSAKLMDRLYASLAAGASPSAALREAKLSLLRSTGAQHKPFYWAPYQAYIR